MAHFWQSDENAAFAPRDVEVMAATLESRHGFHAADMAEFFSVYHAQKGDAGRSCAWAGVADLVRTRALERLIDPD